MLDFCSREALLIVSTQAIILAKASSTSRDDCSEVLAINQSSVTNALNSSLEAAGNLPINLENGGSIYKIILREQHLLVCNGHPAMGDEKELTGVGLVPLLYGQGRGYGHKTQMLPL